jgi:hypothetical protein
MTDPTIRKLQFHVQINDRHLGKVDIYKRVDKVNGYALKLEGTFKGVLFYQKFKQIQQMSNKRLLRMEGSKVEELGYCQGIGCEKVEIYW